MGLQSTSILTLSVTECWLTSGTPLFFVRSPVPRMTKPWLYMVIHHRALLTISNLAAFMPSVIQIETLGCHIVGMVMKPKNDIIFMSVVASMMEGSNTQILQWDVHSPILQC